MSDGPNRTGPVLLVAEGWTDRRTTDRAYLSAFLDQLDPHRTSFIIFEIGASTYVQTLGGPDALVVEARVTRADARFVHVQFRKGPKTGLPVTIDFSGGDLETDSSSALTIDEARAIMLHFIDTEGGFHPAFHADDISAEFES